MGVPKFTRFICERYPCLLEVLNEYQIPEFDNLYLDMNGIIHCCSHPNDAQAQFRITEETIFKNIFLYVEILFRTIKPQKLFFMAVDGVAPRAKINQQRGRRFKAAKEAEAVEAKARARGEVLPDVPRFDSNCITPGTVFMAKLTEQLKHFVTYKISTDRLWQKCKIILSGPEVPGEGEHKIMDYIRYMKSQPDYDPNQRHCLYGLDADLIMLSLCTHEPHFAVLREEVKYGRNPHKSMAPPEKTKFCLLHVSLLREYMEHEFESVKDKLSFDFDIEKIIDDWILMGFLVGNDFIPHLPNLHIANGALPILYQAYMKTLPNLDGYINEAGKLNLSRFEKFMEQLGALDVKSFNEHQVDLKMFEAKTGRSISKDSPVDSDPVKKSFSKDLEALIQSTDDMLLGHSDEEDDFVDTEDSDNETYALEFIQHKQDYYMRKFEYEKVDADVMRKQAEAYVTAIQWNLHYYYDGCRSWSWYYPHHYAPFISDIKDFKDLKFNFELGTPFLPFQQLLAVLPAASRTLLPEPYQNLLTAEESPIINYYPGDFKTDLNEKKQEWEAIVLIPFIDEKNLIDAMKPYNAKLTPEEQKRNSHGPMSMITYTEENLGVVAESPYLPTIESHAKITFIHPKEIEVPPEKLVKGLCEGVKLTVYFPGFPTLQYIPHEAALEKCKVKVFEQPSRGENMILSILPKPAPPINQLASELLGKIIFIKWPHLLEGHVIGVSDGARKFSLINPDAPYSLDNLNRDELKGSGEVQWTSQARDAAMGYKNRFGINVGDIDTLIHVRPITGRRYIVTAQGRMSLQKEWSNIPCYYPYQSIVYKIKVEETGDISHKSISDIYAPKSVCFMLGHPHYGAMGEVVEPGINHKTGRVKVSMNITTEPDFSALKREQHEIKMQYMHGSIAAQRLGISSHLLSRITGSIFVLPASLENSEKKQQNIGLNLKFNKKNEELPGYTRKVNGQWMYSSKSVGLIRSYMEKYPKLFERLVENVGNDIFDEDDLFAEDGEGVVEVVKWLKEQLYRSVESRNCNYEGLDPDIIEKLQNQVDDFVAKNDNGKTLTMQVKPHLLLKPGINNGNIPPDTNAKHRIFDRIIAVKENSCVPLGYKGTIITIHGSNGDSDTVYDVIFDKPFVGGISLTGSANSRRYKLLAAEFINVSHGIRAEQDITGIVNIPEKVIRKKQHVGDANAQGNSAFASFNAHGNFFPVFGKGKQPQQIQQSSQNQQIRVMRKGNNQPVAKNPPVVKNSPVRGDEGRKAEPKPQQIAGKKIDVPPPPVPTVASVEERKPEVNTEFQMLWNELHKHPGSGVNQKPMIPPFPPVRPPPIPQVPMAPPIPDTLWDMRSPPQDPSAFLKAVLKIPDDKSTNESTKTAPSNKKPFTFPPTPPVPTSTAPTSNAPTLVQQLFDHARQARKEISYCARLLNHFQLLGIGMPRYFYSTQKNLVHAQIILPDMRTFYGELCPNHELAAESVAKKVYTELNLDKAPTRRPYFDVLPPEAWLNVQPPVSLPMMSPRSFPDAQKPPVRPPANWNARMPQPQPGFTQMAPPRMNHARPPTRPPAAPQVDNKTEVKQSTPFVPLQAQKKTRSRNPRETHETSHREAPTPKQQKAKPKENSPKITRDEKSTKENEQKSTKDNPPVVQKSHKNPRQRRSRIAANFGSSTAANGGDK